MQTIFISIELQRSISIVLYIHFGVSTVLNVVAFVCLLKETPLNQAKFRNYLIYIQIMLVLNDLNLDILFEPILIFPATGLYCVGFFCRIGVPMQFLVAFTLIVLTNTGVSILTCFFHRHQTIVSEGSLFKFRERTVSVARFGFLILTAVLIIIWALFQTSDLKNYPIDLSWIRTRGLYFFTDRSPDFYVAFGVLAVILASVALVVFLLFIHLFYTLRQDKSKRSSAALQKILRSTIVLFIQLGVPGLFVVIPGGILCLGVVFQIFPFEMCIALFYLIPFHPLAHNLILLGITPAYRKFIISFFRKGYNIRVIQSYPSSPQLIRI